MSEFKVKCELEYGERCFVSKVYAIDYIRDSFLLVDDHNNFIWVRTYDCELV